MTPTLRFYCQATPFQGHHLGFEYLSALHAAGMRVRACPLGFFMPTGPWAKLAHLFTGDLPRKYFVNIVCAPPGLALGAPVGREEAGAPVAPAPGISMINPGDEVVYNPSTAFGGLYTVGVQNVAITRCCPGSNASNEVAALRRYNFVFAPTPEDVEGLRNLNVEAFCLPPDSPQLPQVFAALVAHFPDL